MFLAQWGTGASGRAAQAAVLFEAHDTQLTVTDSYSRVVYSIVCVCGPAKANVARKMQVQCY